MELHLLMLSKILNVSKRKPNKIWVDKSSKFYNRPFTKNKERIQKFKETGDSLYIYENELDKASFQRDMAYGDFKYFN